MINPALIWMNAFEELHATLSKFWSISLWTFNWTCIWMVVDVVIWFTGFGTSTNHVQTSIFRGTIFHSGALYQGEARNNSIRVYQDFHWPMLTSCISRLHHKGMSPNWSGGDTCWSHPYVFCNRRASRNSSKTCCKVH